jgi:hypothetical protein
MTRLNSKIIGMEMYKNSERSGALFEVVGRWMFDSATEALEFQQALTSFGADVADAPCPTLAATIRDSASTLAEALERSKAATTGESRLPRIVDAEAPKADPMGLAPGKDVDDLSTIPNERAPKRRPKAQAAERQATPAEEAIKTDTAAQQRAAAVEEAPEVEAEPVESHPGSVPVELREAKAFGGVMQYLIKDHPLPEVIDFLADGENDEITKAAADAVEAECERVREHVPAIARADKSGLRARIERALEHVKLTQGAA